MNLRFVDIASAYDNWSRTYEKVENRTRDLAAAALRGQTLNFDNQDVLEIGCGTGFNTRYLSERARSVTAVDFSAGMLAQAAKNISAANVTFLPNDIRLKWNVADSSFDLVVCTLVLEHIENLQHIFSEAKRVLQTRGEFLIYELHPFRQLQGGQAQFIDVDSHETVLVPAFSHSVSEFVNTSIDCKFDLVRLEELRDATDKAGKALPRILALHLRAQL